MKIKYEMKLFNYITMLAVVLSATACSYTNHFLDEEEIPGDNALYNTLKDVDATGYGSWTYINLQTGETETFDDTDEWIYGGDGTIRAGQASGGPDIDWHIAVHRYELKTNGASVLNTGITDILSVTELPAGDYTSDTVLAYEDELAKGDNETQYLLVADMSGMMDGNIGYIRNPSVNLVLCDGITRTATGSMPPTLYGTTEDVFVLKWENGDWATLQITGTYSSGGSSGYLSFNYHYYAR